jgi:putative tricarboxylic transport membrane protein
MRIDVMRANDAVTGAILVVVALAMIAATLTFPPFPGQRYGPALFPQALGAGLILCGLLLVRRGLAARRAGAAWAEFPLGRDGRALGNSLAIPLAILVYVLLSDRVGFVPVAAALLFALFLWFRVRPATALATAVVATLAVDWFFGWMFRVPLPLGFMPNSPSAAASNLLRSLF